MIMFTIHFRFSQNSMGGFGGVVLAPYAHIHPQALAHTNNRHKVALIYTVGGGFSRGGGATNKLQSCQEHNPLISIH